MIAILYLMLCMFFGISLVNLCVPNVARLFAACSPSKNITSKVPACLFVIPAGLITGLVTVTMTEYYLTSLLSKFVANYVLCKKLGVVFTMALFVVLGATFMIISYRRSVKAQEGKASEIPEFKDIGKNMFFYGIFTVLFTLVATFLMFYTYRITGNELWAGYSVFSDLAPHTAMTSSFGVGFNVPTQYMHFSGDGIQYHFFFYYLCGILQFLGMPIDFAINVPSILVMVCAFELLGLICVLISKRRISFAIAPILVLFRSSMDFFILLSRYTNEFNMSMGDALHTMRNTTSWFDITPYDNWGIWAINVYPNQRHLMLGVSVMLILIILFMPFVRRMCISFMRSEGKEKILAFAASRNSWLWRKNDPLHPIGIAILGCVLVVTMPFFHGSALIATLLILAFMALFSESRLLYAAVAVCSLVSSFIQTALFSGSASNVVKFQHVTGFVSEDTSFGGVMKYLITVTGFTLIIATIYCIYLLIRDLIKKQPIYRTLLYICFLMPLVFAFNYQVSLEMLANHKFIQFSIILADIFVACALSELFVLPKKVKERLPKGGFIATQTATIILGIGLIFPLTASGWYEWCTYTNLNKNHVTIQMDSPVTQWIVENTEPDDVFLTPAWALNRFYLAGRPSYYGHPYYAWSAGHDTYMRNDIYEWLITGANNDIDEFVRYCRERDIKYLLADPEFYAYSYSGDHFFNEAFFAKNLKPVAYFQSEGTVIYQIY